MLPLEVNGFGEARESGRIDDDLLLSRIAKGDQEAFLQLYKHTARNVYSFILSILKSPQDAEEVMQETYIKVWVSAAFLPFQRKAAGMDFYYSPQSVLYEISGTEA